MPLKRGGSSGGSSGGGGNWIQGAIERPGAFSAKAKRAGQSTQAYARAKQDAPGRLGKQARLALTLSKMRKRK